MAPLRSPYVNDATFDLPFRHLFFEWLFGEAARLSVPHFRHECGLCPELFEFVHDIPVFVIQSDLERKRMPKAKKAAKEIQGRIGDKAKTNRDQASWILQQLVADLCGPSMPFPATVPSEHETPLARDQGFDFCYLVTGVSASTSGRHHDQIYP